MMYRVIYSNDQKLGRYRVIAKVETLREAREAREVSGDIVVDEDGAIVLEGTWLFDWERNTALHGKGAYALRMIVWQESHEEPYLQYLRQTEVK
jgi:hypothetical protein